MAQLSTAQARWLATARTGHLATADAGEGPHVIPVCYAFDGRAIFSVLDQKPKRVAPARLRRVRNIMANPRAALVVDHYDEDWSRLGYILVIGRAELLLEGDERVGAIRMLRDKYRQYRSMDIDSSPVIKITPVRVVAWGAPPS